MVSAPETAPRFSLNATERSKQRFPSMVTLFYKKIKTHTCSNVFFMFSQTCLDCVAVFNCQAAIPDCGRVPAGSTVETTPSLYSNRGLMMSEMQPEEKTVFSESKLNQQLT